MDRRLIDQYEAGSEQLAAAVRGLSREMLLAPSSLGGWTIQQIVLHLMDSDLIATDRMKRVIAEDNPALIGYDESLFAQNLFYEEQSAEDAVTIFGLNRRQFARVLRRLPDSAFERRGTHNQAGEQRLGQMLRNYIQHLEHHLGFIRRKRAKLEQNQS